VSHRHDIRRFPNHSEGENGLTLGFISEEAKRVLQELGLTEYETRAYMSLLERGPMTATQVSEYSNVPYSKIYETLNSLERKGWIKSEKGRPSQYYPKSPAEALTAAKLKLEDTMKGWEQAILNELQPLYDKREIKEKPDIWILRGEFNILAKLQEMLDKAKNELMIAAPVLTKTLMKTAFPMLYNLQNKNVRVLLMISKDIKEIGIEEITNFAEVRTREHMFGGGIIVDGKEALLLLGEEKPSLVIWSNHIGLVKFAKDYFEYLWNTASRH
jgi:sugar-specific transcriptional regulator TrmB